MSLAMAACPSGLYSPSDDTALSKSSAELRGSLETALLPPRESPASSTIALLERTGAALRKGSEIEGVLVNVEPFGHMFDLLRVLPGDIPLPEIVVESDREIGLDWTEGSRRVLSLTIDETPFIGFAALIGHESTHGRTLFAGSLPKILAHCFSRLYPNEPAA